MIPKEREDLLKKIEQSDVEILRKIVRLIVERCDDHDCDCCFGYAITTLIQDNLPTLQHGDDITIALKWPSSMKNGERLVHTSISHYPPNKPIACNTFQANDDDRPEHRLSDRGVTWLLGHASFSCPEAREMIRLAEEADHPGEESS